MINFKTLNFKKKKKKKKIIQKRSINLVQMLNCLVGIKPGEPLSQETLKLFKTNTTAALAILRYVNQNILNTSKDNIR